MAYVVVVGLPEGSAVDTRVYGPWRSRKLADAFAARVQAHVDREDARLLAEWEKSYQGRGEEGEFDRAPAAGGSVVVRHVWEPRIRAAARFAGGDSA